MIRAVWILLTVFAVVSHAQPEAGTDKGHLGVVVPAQQVDLTTEVAGRIEAMHMALGDTVASDQILVEIDSPGLVQEIAQAEAALQGARSGAKQTAAELEELDRQLERRSKTRDAYSSEQLEALETQRRIKRSQLDQAHATSSEREAQLALLQARQDALQIRAPFDGVVSLQHRTVGNYVQPGETLLRLIGLDPPFIRFAVPATQSEWLSPGTPVLVRKDAGGDISWHAVVQRVSPELDPGIEMIFAEANFEVGNGPWLASGTVVRILPQEKTAP